MAITTLALAVENFDFPVISKMRGKPVIIPGLDQERKPPQPYWLENIIPTRDGISTVTYETQIGSSANAAITSVPEINSSTMRDANIYSLITEEGTSTYYLVTPIYHFLYNTTTGVWDEVEDSLTLVNAEDRTSVFFYKGRTILFNKNIGFWSYDYDPVTGYSKTTEVINGVTFGNLNAATAAGGYIIVASEETVYWSSPLSGDNPGDTIEFDPANITLTGAGSSNILALKGSINILVPKPEGFYIYTNNNAIDATNTKNAANPWFFQEVKNSAGAFRTELVTSANNAGLHFVWGDLGLSSVSRGVAELQFPQLTELFTGSLWESWNDLTKEIDREYGVSIEVKISFVSGRYLCFSYGKQGLVKEYSIILDIVLQRWGKLKVDHLDIFDSTPPQITLDPAKQAGNMLAIPANTLFNDPAFNYLDGTAEENFRANTIAVLTSDYELQKVDFSQQTNIGEGFIVYGGVRITRSRYSELHTVEVDGIWDDVATDMEIELMTETNPTWITADWESTDEVFITESLGKEHSVKVKGSYMLSDLIVSLRPEGKW